jgi:hypothetical protein
LTFLSALPGRHWGSILTNTPPKEPSCCCYDFQQRLSGHLFLLGGVCLLGFPYMDSSSPAFQFADLPSTPTRLVSRDAKQPTSDSQETYIRVSMFSRSIPRNPSTLSLLSLLSSPPGRGSVWPPSLSTAATRRPRGGVDLRHSPILSPSRPSLIELVQHLRDVTSDVFHGWRTFAREGHGVEGGWKKCAENAQASTTLHPSLRRRSEKV